MESLVRQILMEGSNESPLFFLPGQGLTEEVATRLRGQTSMVYYEISTHAGQAINKEMLSNWVRKR